MRTLKPLMLMISGFSDVSLSLETMYFYLWRHQDTQNNPRKTTSFLKNISLGNYGIVKLENVGKDACRQILKINFRNSWTVWIWVQYPSKACIGSFVISIQFHWTLSSSNNWILSYFQFMESPHTSPFRFPPLHQPVQRFENWWISGTPRNREGSVNHYRKNCVFHE